MRVEFFGIPRLRAGVGSIGVEPVATLAELCSALAERFPDLTIDCLQPGGLAATCVANLDGQRFARAAETPLAGVRTVMLLSADAGG